MPRGIKKTLPAVVAVATFGLTSCASGAATVTETVTQTVTQTVSGSPSADTSATNNSATEATDSAPASPTLSDRGAIVKKVGDVGGIFAEDGSLAVSFKVTKIDPDFKCTARYAEKSKRGRFVALTFEVKTSKALQEVTGYSDAEIDVINQWTFVGEDGTVMNGTPNSGAASMCIDSDDSVPKVGPASKGGGLFVVDIPKGAGFLVMSPYWGDQGKWEWQVGKA